MKNICLKLMMVLIVTQFSCHKLRYNEMLLVRDCTGTYLRDHGKDYLVCNEEQLAPYEEGVVIAAKYKRVRSCDDAGRVVCLMAHEHEGWIEVISIQ